MNRRRSCRSKSSLVASIATALPNLASVRMLPWARANLNHTAQALTISTVAGAAHFIVCRQDCPGYSTKELLQAEP
ncbi:hypothetical protein RCOM_0639430 [Ricinus communis]|uniref:Uncharacterized protein n=1 Tax=Ricinus communis TaxID=3988 RepID=B9T3Y9_RICCO|nr:hypothetical protein RCOM_0639430 [Ricinus communis]